MAIESINRIKAVKTFAVPLPDPPKLSQFITKGVLTQSGAEAFDLENKRHWDRCQHILKTQWLQET